MTSQNCDVYPREVGPPCSPPGRAMLATLTGLATLAMPSARAVSASVCTALLGLAACGPVAPQGVQCEAIAVKMNACSSVSAASKSRVVTACKKQLELVSYDCQMAVDAYSDCVVATNCSELTSPISRCTGLSEGIALYCTGSVRFEDPDRQGRFTTWFYYWNS